MAMETALRSRLVEDEAVSAIVGDRVHWVSRPERGALPAIVLQLIDETWDEHFKGRSGPASSRVQIDCMAAGGSAGGLDTTRQLYRAARDCLLPGGSFGGVRFARALPDGVRDLSERTEDGTFINRVSIDLIVRHYGELS